MSDAAWAVIHSSDDLGWRTPPEVFDPLHAEFGFVLDACATRESALCPLWIPPETDALVTPWDRNVSLRGKSVWLNPPYGREVGKWVRRAYEQSRMCGATVVVLVMACTDTRWWSDWAWKAEEVRFVKGRVRFLTAATGERANAAPKGSAVLVFTPTHTGDPKSVILTSLIAANSV